MHQELANKIYQHGPYQPFYVTDPKLRHIHKANVRDRLFHHAIFRILYPIFDRRFIYDSYSCRVGKGTHRAVRRLRYFAIKEGQNNRRNFWALKCDVKKFFDSINQRILRELILKRIDDPGVVWLVDRVLESFCKEAGKGLPLGNVTSQLFANIYLNELDQFVKGDLKIKYYLRYCDDFIILNQDYEKLLAIKDRIDYFLQQKLRLTLHPNKIIIRKYNQGIDFLGYVVRPHHVVLRTKTKRRVLKRLSEDCTEVSSQSYLGILKHCNGYKLENRFKQARIK